LASASASGSGYDYDLLAIGCGPAGQKAAIQAAKLGRRVALVERRQVGGVCVITGTIPSKTLREAVLHLTGFAQRGVYGQSYRVKEEITVEDLRSRYLAGTRPARPDSVAFDDRTVFDSDTLFLMERIPGSLVVVGGGVVGIEYASIFATLGSRVTVVDKRRRILEFCDDEILEGLQHHLWDLGLTFRLGEEVTSMEALDEGALVRLASGKRIAAEMVLYSAGRQGSTDDLGLGNAGLEADDRGRIAFGPYYRTRVEHIYAVGDVVGFPALAATAMEQGRIAALDALGQPVRSSGGLVPIGIYTIPEISFVGRTESEPTDAGIGYEVGISRYRELARGAILADNHGMLKILVSPADRQLLGVHVLGTGATELVHIGQAVMGNGGTLDYLVDNVFNYPTLAEAYKVAALDAMNKLSAVSRLSD
jgi:NAD(P) transhydrogenase